MELVTIAFFGDIVGKPGRSAVSQAVPVLKERYKPDLIIANSENSAGGSGITPSTFQKITSYGVDVLTSGDHIYRNKEYPGIIDKPTVLRPANYPIASAGRGFGVFQASNGVLVGVVNLMGRIFMEAQDSPFTVIDRVLEELSKKVKIIFVDFHAEATSEKQAMGWYLDGKVSAVVGTHTHVQTADERILPGGTAYLTDAGMSGPYDSVIGRDYRPVLHKLVTGMPMRFDVATERPVACGVVVQIDAQTGQAQKIERFQIGDHARSGKK